MANLFDVNGDIITIPDLSRARFSFNEIGGGALCVREYSDSGLTTLVSEINFRFRDKIAFGLVRPGHVYIVGKTLERGSNTRVMKEFYIGPRERHAVRTLTEIVKAFYSWIEAHPERHPDRARWVLVPNECCLQDAEIRSPRDGGPVVAHKGHHVRYELSGENFLRFFVDSLLRERIIPPATPLPESFVLCEQHHYWCPAVENLFLEYGGQFPPELILLPIGRRTLMQAGEPLFVAEMPRQAPLPPASSGNPEAEPAPVPEDEKNGEADDSDEDVQDGTPEEATFYAIFRYPDQYISIRCGKDTIIADGGDGDGGDNGKSTENEEGPTILEADGYLVEIRRLTDPKTGTGLPAGPGAAASIQESRNTDGVVYIVTSHGICSHWFVNGDGTGSGQPSLEEVDPVLDCVAEFIAEGLTAAIIRGQSTYTWPHSFTNPGLVIKVLVNGLEPLGEHGGKNGVDMKKGIRHGNDGLESGDQKRRGAHDANDEPSKKKFDAHSDTDAHRPLRLLSPTGTFATGTAPESGPASE